MTRKQLQSMYEELSLWLEANIADDILNESMRPEYQEFVQEQRDKGVADEDISQQVLWRLRELLKEMPMDRDEDVKTSEETETKKDTPATSSCSKVVITVGSVKIEVFE